MKTEEMREICPLRIAMDIIGGKWKMSIICLLKDGESRRYNQIKRGIPGITNVMLANSLKSLEEYGIVDRKQYNEVPVRVEYRLTKGGAELLEVLGLLKNWGDKYIHSSGELRSHCPQCLYRDGE